MINPLGYDTPFDIQGAIYSRGQASVAHELVSSAMPLQAAPPPDGAGSSQTRMRVCTPPSQVAEQAV